MSLLIKTLVVLNSLSFRLKVLSVLGWVIARITVLGILVVYFISYLCFLTADFCRLINC